MDNEEAVKVLQSWWDYVWTLKLEEIAAGRVINMFNPRSLSVFRGGDKRLSSLYVRRSFEPLFKEICDQSVYAVDDWLCHINGNSGVGKSAFLWYFIIRAALVKRDCIVDELDDEELHILYESAGFIWEFKGNTVHVAKRDKFNADSFINASWHLINQKVPEDGFLGKVVLVAASPAKANVKAAKADRKKTVMYMYPWEKDEYEALCHLWKTHYDNLESELNTLRDDLCKLENWADIKFEFGRNVMLSVGTANLAQVPKVKERVEQLLREDVKKPDDAGKLAFTLQVFIKVLERQLQDGIERLKAAPDYYKWFGGVVRLLWSGHFKSLNPEGFSTSVKESLKNTDLLQLIETVQEKSQGENISRALLHFLKPDKSTSFLDYCLGFCSVKVQAHVTVALTKMKAEDLEFFMRIEIADYGVLRGFVFEELSIAYVLHASMMMPMGNDKHCNKCKSCEDPSRGYYEGKWVACDVCEQWYHFSCATVAHKLELKVVLWQCTFCEGRISEEPKRLLRYYEGDLKTALLDAGADAIQYVWRPVIKNNGAVDYTILPFTLAQPTLATRHPISAEALTTHVDALLAWNEVYCSSMPKEFVLCFFLAESNYDEFGFQSYRDKSRRVTKQAVKGIRQCKVLLRYDVLWYDVPVRCVEEMEIPKGVEMVDCFEQCKFDGEVCETNFFDPAEDLFRYEEMSTNKKRKFAFVGSEAMN